MGLRSVQTGARFVKVATDANGNIVAKLGRFHSCTHYNDSAANRLLYFYDGLTVFAKLPVLAGQSASLDYGDGGRPMTGIVAGDTFLTVSVTDGVTGNPPVPNTGITEVTYS